MNLAPGMRCLVAFHSPCCGCPWGTGRIIVIGEIVRSRDMARAHGHEFAYCKVCRRQFPDDQLLAYVVEPRGYVHVCRLVPLPPDDEADELFNERPIEIPFERMRVLRDVSMGGCEHYTLNEDGRELAKNPHYVPRILRHLSRKARVAKD